jgi:hypothetical protein
MDDGVKDELEICHRLRTCTYPFDPSTSAPAGLFDEAGGSRKLMLVLLLTMVLLLLLLLLLLLRLLCSCRPH